MKKIAHANANAHACSQVLNCWSLTRMDSGARMNSEFERRQDQPGEQVARSTEYRHEEMERGWGGGEAQRPWVLGVVGYRPFIRSR